MINKNISLNIEIKISFYNWKLYWTVCIDCSVFTRATGVSVQSSHSIVLVSDCLAVTHQRMDLLAILVTITSIYILVCILFSLFIDGDLTTFMYTLICNGLTKNLAGKFSHTTLVGMMT